MLSHYLTRLVVAPRGRKKNFRWRMCSMFCNPKAGKKPMIRSFQIKNFNCVLDIDIILGLLEGRVHTCIRRRRLANVRMRSRIRRTASCSSRHVLVGTSRHCCAAASRNLACAALTPSKDCAVPISYTPFARLTSETIKATQGDNAGHAL